MANYYLKRIYKKLHHKFNNLFQVPGTYSIRSEDSFGTTKLTANDLKNSSEKNKSFLREKTKRYTYQLVSTAQITNKDSA